MKRRIRLALPKGTFGEHSKEEQGRLARGWQMSRSGNKAKDSASGRGSTRQAGDPKRKRSARLYYGRQPEARKKGENGEA